MATIVVGGQFGDEGKGKIISYLASHDGPDFVARAGVGPNAGHTVYKDGRKYGLRMIPCGFVNPRARLLVGAGVLINPQLLLDEIRLTESQKRVGVDGRCAVIEEKHRKLDVSDKHLKGKVGSTGTGCGPANEDRVHRTIKLAREIPELAPYVTDVPLELNEALRAGKKVLVEASQGFGLSLFYGTYPYVTSKDTTASMAATDVGLGPTRIREVIVVYKAYVSRVGGGPFKTQINEENIKEDPLWQEILERAIDAGVRKDSVNETLAEYFGEKGTVTGRPRRIGFFDLGLAKYSSMINGATQIALTCVDKVFPECGSAVEYENLSDRATGFIKKIETELKVRVTLISTGPNADDVVDLRGD